MPDMLELYGPDVPDADVRARALAQARALRQQQEHGLITQASADPLLSSMGGQAYDSATKGLEGVEALPQARMAAQKAKDEETMRQQTQRDLLSPEAQQFGSQLVKKETGVDIPGLPYSIAKSNLPQTTKVYGTDLGLQGKVRPAEIKVEGALDLADKNNPVKKQIAAGHDATTLEKERLRGTTARDVAQTQGGQETLEPQVIQALADKARTEGGRIDLPRGKQWNKARKDIYTKMIADDPLVNLAMNGTDFKAQDAVVKKMAVLDATVGNFEQTGRKNLARFVDAAKSVLDLGAPILNQPARYVLEKFAGDHRVSAFRTAHAVATNEIAKVLSGATGSASVTKSAKEEADSLFPLDATIEQLVASQNEVLPDLDKRIKSIREAAEAGRAKIKGITSNRPGAGKALPRAAGQQPAAQVVPAGPPQIHSIDEYNALPDGPYIDPNGKPKIKKTRAP